MAQFGKIINILIISIMLTTLAVRHNGKLMGVSAKEIFSTRNNSSIISKNDLTLLAKTVNIAEYNIVLDSAFKVKQNNKKYIIPTKTFSKNIYGYGGEVNLYILINNAIIEQIILGENSETESFLERIRELNLLTKWNRKNLAKPASEIGESNKIDAISGATYTSNAIISSIEKTIAKIETKNETKDNLTISTISLSQIIAIAVLALGLIIAYRKKRIKYSRQILLLANVIVLGFWCGNFLSVNLLLNWLSNGLNLYTSITLVILLILALLMPLLDKKEYYCKWVCPFGSAQELMYQIGGKKITLNVKTIANLTKIREMAILLIIALMYIGVGFETFNYEPFAAFLFTTAELPIIIIALTALILSIFISRPWCRFVCPTGQIATWIEKL